LFQFINHFLECLFESESICGLLFVFLKYLPRSLEVISIYFEEFEVSFHVIGGNFASMMVIQRLKLGFIQGAEQLQRLANPILQFEIVCKSELEFLSQPALTKVLMDGQ